MGLGRGDPSPNRWHGVAYPIDPARYWPVAGPDRWLGFSVHHRSDRGREQYWVAVPYWFVLLASAGVFIWFWRWTRPRSELARGFEVQLAARENGHG